MGGQIIPHIKDQVKSDALYISFNPQNKPAESRLRKKKGLKRFFGFTQLAHKERELGWSRDINLEAADFLNKEFI